MSQTRKFISRNVNLTKLQLGGLRSYRFIRRVVKPGKGTAGEGGEGGGGRGGEDGRWTDRIKLKKKADNTTICTFITHGAKMMCAALRT